MLLCCVKTINDAFLSFKQSLSSLYYYNEIQALTLLIINEVTQLSKATIKAFPERELTDLQQQSIASILTQLTTGKPLQYILGYAEFYGLRFNVSPATLIPRPETEELVEWALSSWQFLIGSLQQPHNILDIGTGSGCIAISMKKNFSNVNVSAIDISPKALQVAKSNAELNHVNVEFIEANILTHPDSYLGSKLSTQYSLIISNPPYVTPADKELMHLNVVDFEPHTALFVPQEDPLLFYRAIAGFAINNLVANGLLFFEINESYGNETVDLLKNMGFKNIELKKDMSDRYRMVKATL